MHDEILFDMTNGLCGVQVDEDEWEFALIVRKRMFVEYMELHSAGKGQDFTLKPNAKWQSGWWIETFRIGWKYEGSAEVRYVLRGDREVAGILCPEET